MMEPSDPFQSPPSKWRVPNWLLLAAVFVLGASSVLLAQHFGVLRFRGDESESVAVSKLGLDHLRDTEGELNAELDAAIQALDRFRTKEAGGMPVDLEFLGLSDSQKQELRRILAMTGPAADSIRSFVTPRLNLLQANTIREMACVLTPVQRRRWRLSLSAQTIAWETKRGNDSVVVYVDENLGRPVPPPPGYSSAMVVLGEKASENLGLFSSADELDRWCYENRPR